METIRFSLPPPELSCLIGNLFTELEAPCKAVEIVRDGIAICGYTVSGQHGELHIFKDSCTFTGRLEDYQVARFGYCPGRKCNAGI